MPNRRCQSCGYECKCQVPEPERFDSPIAAAFSRINDLARRVRELESKVDLVKVHDRFGRECRQPISWEELDRLRRLEAEHAECKMPGVVKRVRDELNECKGKLSRRQADYDCLMEDHNEAVARVGQLEAQLVRAGRIEEAARAVDTWDPVLVSDDDEFRRDLVKLTAALGSRGEGSE